MKGKGAEITIFLIILIVGFGAIYYFVSDKIKNKEEVTTTTTTTTTTREAVRLLEIKSFENYRYNSPVNNTNRDLYLRDDSFKKIDLEVSNRCSRNYQTVEFERNGNHIMYKCNAVQGKYDTWEVRGRVNDKLEVAYFTDDSCGLNDIYYSNGDYYIRYVKQGCLGSSDIHDMKTFIEIYDKDVNQIERVAIEWPVFYKNKEERVRPFVSKNILYYITKDENGICRVNYYDFESKEKKDLTSFAC